MSIQKQWEMFRSVVPADSLELGRRRTRYFWRKQAIEWRQFARFTAWSAEQRAMAVDLAKYYLWRYRLEGGAA